MVMMNKLVCTLLRLSPHSMRPHLYNPVPYTYAQRVCAGFAALGTRGVSVMFSSGDGGVGDGNPDPATQECYTNTGVNRTVFLPEFPAACP